MTDKYEQLLKIYLKKIEDERMVCIDCGEPARHIYTFLGTGGFYCHNHLTEAQEKNKKANVELQKKLEELYNADNEDALIEIFSF